MPETIGGSGDLTPSNNTRSKGMKEVTPDDFSGRYIHWGIREHGMAAALNGMALHGGIIPYSGTFLVFTDYCRPSIRLAALMGLRVIFVMTHDSIGLGEDGPTHQPVEHLAALRAIPGPQRLPPGRRRPRPPSAGSRRSRRKATPSVIALTRQNVAALRTEFVAENLSARGAYEIAAAEGERRGEHLCDRLRGRDRGRRQGADREGRPFRPRRLGALLRALRRAERRLQGRRSSATRAVNVAIEAAVRHGLGPLHRQ